MVTGAFTPSVLITMFPQLVTSVNFPTLPGSIFVGGVMTIGLCPTAVVDLQVIPPINLVDVGTTDGVAETVGVGVGVFETVGVDVGVDACFRVGVFEQAERLPTSSATIAKYIPRFTSRPFPSGETLSTTPIQ